jgi:thiol-disulfide isomerase/thioredoxin
MAAALSAILFLPCAAKAADQAGALDLSAYRGKVVYLDFWASWCAPCRLSFPWLNAMAETLGPKGLVVIGVNVDRDRAPADEFLRENEAHFRIVYDPAGEIAHKYEFEGMPTSILIGRDGKVQATHSGFFREREGSYYADVARLLNGDSGK